MPDAKYENIENYDLNRWWFWYLYLANAAELCQDEEYIQTKYHPKEITPSGTYGQTEAGVEVLEL